STWTTLHRATDPPTSTTSLLAATQPATTPTCGRKHSTPTASTGSAKKAQPDPWLPSTQPAPPARNSVTWSYPAAQPPTTATPSNNSVAVPKTSAHFCADAVWLGQSKQPGVG